MIRLFNVYYPVRTLILLGGEALIVWTSFLLGAWRLLGQAVWRVDAWREAMSSSPESRSVEP